VQRRADGSFRLGSGSWRAVIEFGMVDLARVVSSLRAPRV